jgi:hypothetical protein
MAKFVTIKTMKRAQAIERSGVIKAHAASFLIPTKLKGSTGLWYHAKVVYAMPVSTNYVVSHQWIAEIQSNYAHVPVSAIYFDLPDEQMVYFGHYAAAKLKATAGEVCAYFYQELQKDDFSHLMGFEVLIPCDSVENIKRIKHDMDWVGWRTRAVWMVTNRNLYNSAVNGKLPYQVYLKRKYS